MRSYSRLRSVMFVPADEPDKMDKAVQSQSDAVVFDLEDGVSKGQKTEARNTLRRFLSETNQSKPSLFVRVNPPGTHRCKSDLEELQGLTVHGFVLPKSESPEQVRDFLARVESDWSDPHHIDAIPLLESATGVFNCYEIAQLEGVRCVAFGSLDYLNDVQGSWNAGGDNILYARSKIINESRAAGADPPLDTVWPHIQDLEGLRDELEVAVELGFQGKLLIHPSQIEPTNDAFYPDDDEIQWARKVVEKSEAVKDGEKAVMTVEGEMIDAPALKRAKRILNSVQ